MSRSGKHGERPIRVFSALLIIAAMGAAVVLAISDLKNPVIARNAPVVTVYKSPSCQCCSKWVSYLRKNGFEVVTKDDVPLEPLKTKFGIPHSLAACHTATVNGYVIEGHVPVTDIHRLLAEKPRARGIAVPGMPVGSPGMEHGDDIEVYSVLLFQPDGRYTEFSRYGEKTR
jgi:hypothetical protein